MTTNDAAANYRLVVLLQKRVTIHSITGSIWEPEASDVLTFGTLAEMREFSAALRALSRREDGTYEVVHPVLPPSSLHEENRRAFAANRTEVERTHDPRLSTPRRTTDDLQREGVPPHDPRWLLVCNHPACPNLLIEGEHLVCAAHEPRTPIFYTVEKRDR